MATDPKRDKPTNGADATCDIAPDRPPPADEGDTIGSGTCDFQPGRPAPPAGAEANTGQTEVLGTCDFRPSPPPVPEAEATSGHTEVLGTCDFQPRRAAPSFDNPDDGTVIGGTCDFVPGQGGATQGGRGEVAGTTSGRGSRQETLERDLPAGDVTGEYGAATGAVPGDATGHYVAGATNEAAARETSYRAAPDRTRSGPAGEYFAAATPKGTSRYFLKKFHAKGGMGEIWLAEDTDLGRQVALKRMLRGKQKDQFLHEAQVTGQLEHPGVIPVHELSVDDTGEPFYIMKFVHGQTLKEVIADYHKAKGNKDYPREVQWLRLLNIFMGLCQTVAYAHSRGVIHRDIKPDNVMVGAYGETLVLDWGLAKVVGKPDTEAAGGAIQLNTGDDTMATMAGSIKGSPFYFAPEVAAGRVDLVDQISDIYLLGGTLYQIVTGRTPREGKKISQLIELAKNTPPAPPRTLDATIPKPLEAICQKALAHQKEDRYQTAGALAEDVQRFLAGEPVSAYRENLWERSWRWVKRHRQVLTRSAAALVIAGTALTAYLLIRDAELRSAEAERVAGELQGQNRARQDINSFKALAEEARFYAANAGAVTEDAPSVEPAKAELKAKEALAFADRWGHDLEHMPLEAQRPGLKKNIYDLLLEVSQVKVRQPGKEAAGATKAYLDRAAALDVPTRSLYRLRARSLEALDQKDQAKADAARAQDPQVPTTALDHFLDGEQLRTASVAPAKGSAPQDAQIGTVASKARTEALTKANESYRRALRLDPNHYWSHYQLGQGYVGLEKYAAAVEAYGTCVALRPETPWGYSARALPLLMDQRHADALTDLNHALQLDPEFRHTRLLRGNVYWKRGLVEQANGDGARADADFALAEADFTAVLAPPDDKRLLSAAISRGQMYMEIAKAKKPAEQTVLFNKALADFDLAVANKFENRAMYLHRARIHLVQGNTDKLLKDLTVYLTIGKPLDPESAEAHELRGRELRLLTGELPVGAVNRRENGYFLALAQLDKAFKLGGQTATLYGEIGFVEEKLAGLRAKEAVPRLKQAIAAYTRGLDKAPKDAKLLVQRGWAQVNLDLNENAQKDFAAAVAIDPEHGEAFAGLGYTEAVLKLPANARRHANQAVLFGAGDYLVLHNVACIFATLSRTDPPRAVEYQDVALAQLRRGIDLWQKGNKKGDDALRLIRVESSFGPEFRARPEFKKLLEGR